MREIGGDSGVLLRSSEAEQAEPRHERDARQRIERALDAPDTGILAREIGVVALDERGHRRAHGSLEVVRSVAFGCRSQERPVFRPDRVVGRHHARLTIARELRPIGEIEDRGTGAEFENHTPPRPFDPFVLAAARAAQDGCDGRDRRDRLWQVRRHENCFALLLQPLLGQRDQRNHAFIGVARAVAKAEDAVLVQDQALDCGLGVVNFRGGLGEKESRHHVGNDAHTPVVEFRADRLAVRLIGDAQDRTGVGVIDEFVREECVQQRLDRGVGRCWLEQALPLDAYHLFVAQRCACAQLAQAVEPHGR